MSEDDESAKGAERPPVVAYQLTITFIPSTGELALDGPLGERHICYQMLELTRERLLMIALQLEMAAQKKRLITGMNN